MIFILLVSNHGAVVSQDLTLKIKLNPFRTLLAASSSLPSDAHVCLVILNTKMILQYRTFSPVKSASP